MSLKLIITRHAKAESAGLGEPDHARHLAPRGRSDAAAIGRWLAATGHVPDLIICSDALRTRQTMDAIRGALPPSVEVVITRALYNADPGTILSLLTKATAPCVMVVAHNPGVGMLAQYLARRAPDAPAFDDYPTAATTVLRFDAADWALIDKGDVEAFATPADLV